MSELNVTAARSSFPDAVSRAENGEVTYLTRHGRRVAAIVPVPLSSTKDESTVSVDAVGRSARLDVLVTRVLTEDARLLQRLGDS